MGNDIVKDAHCEFTMGNDIARDIHYYVTMSNDIAMCTYHSIKMHNDIAMNLFYCVFSALCLIMILLCVVCNKNKNKFMFDQSGLERTFIVLRRTISLVLRTCEISLHKHNSCVLPRQIKHPLVLDITLCYNKQINEIHFANYFGIFHILSNEQVNHTSTNNQSIFIQLKYIYGPLSNKYVNSSFKNTNNQLIVILNIMM